MLDIIFFSETGDPISFCTSCIPSPEVLNEAIRYCGGEVTDAPGPNTVYLVPEPKPASMTTGMDPPYNTFSVGYINDCLWEETLQPLKNYWVHKASDFDDENYDPVLVMVGLTTWEECKRPVPESSGVTNQETSVEFMGVEEDEDTDEEDRESHLSDVLMEVPEEVLLEANRFARAREAYSVQEDINIIDYLAREKAYRFQTKSLWQEMAAHFYAGGRSWKSLRRQYKTKILPRIRWYIYYGASEKEVRRFERYSTKKKKGSHKRSRSRVEDLLGPPDVVDC